MSHQMIPQQPQQDHNPEPEALRNLMVNYIPTTVDEMQLRQLFERFGPIESVKIVCDHDTRQSRGYGFVKFQSSTSAQQAIMQLNGFSILNKHLKIALAATGNQRQRNNPNPNPAPNMNMYYGGNFNGYQAPNPYTQQQMLAMQQQYMMQAAQQQPR